MPSVSVNIPTHVLGRVEKIVKEERKSRSQVITELLKKALEIE